LYTFTKIHLSGRKKIKGVGGGLGKRYSGGCEFQRQKQNML